MAMGCDESLGVVSDEKATSRWQLSGLMGVGMLFSFLVGALL
jgi:hypothetical protein